MTWLLLAVLFLPPQDPKLPVPDAAALKDADTLLHSVFKDDFAKKGLSDRLALAQKLFAQGLETKDDPPSRYVLLREAKDLSLAAGDFDAATRAAEEVARSFEADITPWKAAILTAAAKAAKTPEEFLKLAKSWLALADEAKGVDQTAVAEKAAQEASALAKKGKDIALIAKAEAKGREVADRKARAEELRKARETLAAKPDDPAACLQVGRHECLVLGHWEKGIPLLAKGSDPALKDLAARDLAGPQDAAGRAAVGDGWWDLAEKESGDRQEKCRARARGWYAKAIGGLTGLEKAKVAKRLGDSAAAQFAGDWRDITDPRLFGKEGQAGDPIALEAPHNARTGRVDLIKPPEGEFDGVSARIQPAADGAVFGYLAVDGYSLSAYYDPALSSFTVLRADFQKSLWVRERVVAVPARKSLVLTILLDGADYVFHLDGKEITRWKATTGKLLPLSLQAQGGKVLFDQIKLRVKS